MGLAKSLFQARTYHDVLSEQVEKPQPYANLGANTSVLYLLERYSYREMSLLGAPTMKPVEGVRGELVVQRTSLLYPMLGRNFLETS